MKKDIYHPSQATENDIADTPLSDGWNQPLSGHFLEHYLE
jgi:hypothetical protein